jgi:hypothetical protein
VRVYAESNFVLEIVLAQEQHAACKDFVTLADRHEVELVLPAFSLFEPLHDPRTQEAGTPQASRAA